MSRNVVTARCTTKRHTGGRRKRSRLAGSARRQCATSTAQANRAQRGGEKDSSVFGIIVHPKGAAFLSGRRDDRRTPSERFGARVASDPSRFAGVSRPSCRILRRVVSPRLRFSSRRRASDRDSELRNVASLHAACDASRQRYGDHLGAIPRPPGIGYGQGDDYKDQCVARGSSRPQLQVYKVPLAAAEPLANPATWNSDYWPGERRRRHLWRPAALPCARAWFLRAVFLPPPTSVSCSSFPSFPSLCRRRPRPRSRMSFRRRCPRPL